MTERLDQANLESGKKNREGTAARKLGSFLSGDSLSGLPKSNSFACEGSNIKVAKSCPTNGGNLIHPSSLILSRTPLPPKIYLSPYI